MLIAYRLETRHIIKPRILLLLLVILLVGGILRFYHISQNPPGLYIDEVAIGRNAYTILISGKDEYGTPYPLAFKSFGDYKLPVYIYLVSISMAFLDKSELAVRFPSAILGTLTIVIVFFIIRELFEDRKKRIHEIDYLALVGAAIFAILPWHIHFSRGGFEVTVALFFYSLGILFGIRYLKKSIFREGLMMILFFVIAMYTYHSYRIRVPITLLIGGIYVSVTLGKKYLKSVGILLGIFMVLSLPLILFTLSPSGHERMNQTTAFITGGKGNALVSLITDVLIFIHNYLSFFSLTYFFHLGDQINRHQIPNFGLLYLWQLPLMLLGVYYLVRTKNILLKGVIFSLLLIGPIPAAVALPSPHTLRNLMATLPYTLLTVAGIHQIYLYKKNWSKWLLTLVSFLVVIEGLYFINYSFVHYPKEVSYDWGGKCKEVAEGIRAGYPRYIIVVDIRLACGPEYFAFYIPNIPIEYASATWRRSMVDDRPVLYIRPFDGKLNAENILYTIYLSDVEHKIFAQFFLL